MEWPGTETCPKTWTIANNSEIMHRIEILRSRYVLQLLILSTRTHFQRVSEHYMVTRTSLWILTLERMVKQVPSTIVVRHPQFFCGKVVQSVHTLYYVYILLLTVLGKLTPHTLPPHGKKLNTTKGGGMGSIICLVHGTKDTGGGLIFSMYGKWER